MSALNNREYAAKHNITRRQASKIQRLPHPFTCLNQRAKDKAALANVIRLNNLRGPSSN